MIYYIYVVSSLNLGLDTPTDHSAIMKKTVLPAPISITDKHNWCRPYRWGYPLYSGRKEDS